MLRYCALFSGSSGNATYIGTAEGGVLIDVGVSARRIETALTARQIDPRTIRAVLITHEHSDHVAGLPVLCRRYGWPVIASTGTLDALAAGDKVTAEQKLYAVAPGGGFHIGDITVRAFSTPHDSRQCLGYRIDADDRAMAVATDIGYMTGEIRQAIAGCKLIHIESNHDPIMLRNGPYPLYLKERIAGAGGHLSNAACAETLPELVEAGAERFVLAHLSQHNNTPTLAAQTATAALAEAGVTVGRDCLLDVAAPEGTAPVLYF